MDISKTNNDNNDDSKEKQLPMVKVGKRNLSAVFITLTKEEKTAGKSNILSFTPAETNILNTFLDVLSHEETAKICNITVASVKRVLRRKDLKRYLEELLEQSAIKAGTTINWLIADLRKIAEGIKEPNDIQMKALKEIREIIKPKTPGLAVNINTGNTFYAGMDQGKVNAEILDAESTATP